MSPAASPRTTAISPAGPELTLASTLPARKPAGTSALIVAMAPGTHGPVLIGAQDHLEPETVTEIEASLKTVGASGESGEITRVVAPSAVRIGSVLAIGCGQEPTAESIRCATGSAARALIGVDTAFTTLSTLHLESAAEGFYLGAYTFTGFRSSKSAPKKSPLKRVVLLTDNSRSKENKLALERAITISEAVVTARNFVNTPPSHLFPAEFADQAKKLGTAAGLKVQILDEKALEKSGYGGIIGVGKGSARPPRLVRLSHLGGTKRNSPTVALVGKGITFDTGGISIKPAAGMENMTSDMGGAAAVIATVILAAKLNLPINVIATVPMAENMPSATAQRPGDVLTQYGGVTVEVINTDAEGRLILADAIVRACEDNPDYLIDTATLTGAQMVALGTRTPGIMGTNTFRDRVAAISQQVGENGWAMPLPDELRADLNSRVADLANVTPHRWGGMLAAGLYLKEFVTENVQWAHIDIAGPAFNTAGAFGYTSKGGTGVPVRTMFAVLEDIAANG
ncbi:MAG: leucyl aminopeptidase [Mycobacteriaceae bacterium]